MVLLRGRFWTPQELKPGEKKQPWFSSNSSLSWSTLFPGVSQVTSICLVLLLPWQSEHHPKCLCHHDEFVPSQTINGDKSFLLWVVSARCEKCSYGNVFQLHCFYREAFKRRKNYKSVFIILLVFLFYLNKFSSNSFKNKVDSLFYLITK